MRPLAPAIAALSISVLIMVRTTDLDGATPLRFFFSRLTPIFVPASISRFINASKLTCAVFRHSLSLRDCVLRPDPGAPIIEQIQASFKRTKKRKKEREINVGAEMFEIMIYDQGEKGRPYPFIFLYRDIYHSTPCLFMKKKILMFFTFYNQYPFRFHAILRSLVTKKVMT